MNKGYILIFGAILSNLTTIYFMKLSNGLTSPWPILAMLFSNLLLLWLLGSVLASGVNVGIAMTMLNVGVMLGALVIGVFFNERITMFQGIGITIAVVGVMISNLDLLKTA